MVLAVVTADATWMDLADRWQVRACAPLLDLARYVVVVAVVATNTAISRVQTPLKHILYVLYL